MSVRDYLTDEWLPAVKATIKPSTYLSYQTHVERHINPTIGSIPLQKLSGAAINAFYAKLLAERRQAVEQQHERSREERLGENGPAEKKVGPNIPPPLSPLTVRRIHATVSKSLADAVRWNRIPRNPALVADPPKITTGEHREMKTWTAKDWSMPTVCPPFVEAAVKASKERMIAPADRSQLDRTE